MICAWTLTSSAETASSQTTKSGFSATARAMPMRCSGPLKIREDNGMHKRAEDQPSRAVHVPFFRLDLIADPVKYHGPR